MMARITAVAGLCLACLWSGTAAAQVGVFELPPDGTWVRYEGTYSQVEIRPDSTLGKLEIPPWIEHVWIKSVGAEQGMYQGKEVPCRWLEIKIERGRERDGKLDTGVTGTEIYKVLVPDSGVIENPKDEKGVPVSFLPVIKGFRKIGQGEATPITQPALQLYPVGLVLGYYRNWETAEKDVDPEVGLGAVKADQLDGKVNIESPGGRTIQETSIWRSRDVPFGLARWKATITRETKDARQPRAEYKPVSEINVEVRAREKGEDAQSELMVP